MGICPRCSATYPEGERFCPADATILVEEHDLARLGQTIGNYRLTAILGRGGMGTVYRGEHVYIGKPVAVKILHPRFASYDDAIKRFLREARAASSIAHPNIVDVTDFGPLPEGGVYIVMEFVEGKSLEDVLLREAPLPLHRAIPIVDQIASALAAAHEKGIIHRDLKPENVMLTTRPGRRELVRSEVDATGAPRYTVEPEGTFELVKVLDFGIAKVREPGAAPGKSGMTLSGMIVGTPEYMSPEGAQGEPVDHRADIYALGCIFYDMITGHVPFEGGTPVEVLARHVTEAPRPPRQVAPGAEITEAAERLILRALAKRPEQRQQSMDELREELRGCWGRVAFRRDAAHLAGADAAGVGPRARRLTEELDEWLRDHRGQLDAAARRLEAIAADPSLVERARGSTPDWDELIEPLLRAADPKAGGKA